MQSDFGQKVGDAKIDRQGQTKGSFGSDPDVQPTMRPNPTPTKP